LAPLHLFNERSLEHQRAQKPEFLTPLRGVGQKLVYRRIHVLKVRAVWATVTKIPPEVI
jgi:hypothetical protein